jgi:hypothetical protein
VLSQRGQKHYTVFVCVVAAGVKDTFTPVLNEEHREWRWFAPGEMRDAAAAAGTAAAAPPPAPLHPVVEVLIREHPRALG